MLKLTCMEKYLFPKVEGRGVVRDGYGLRGWWDGGQWLDWESACSNETVNFCIVYVLCFFSQDDFVFQF